MERLWDNYTPWSYHRDKLSSSRRGVIKDVADYTVVEEILAEVIKAIKN